MSDGGRSAALVDADVLAPGDGSAQPVGPALVTFDHEVTDTAISALGLSGDTLALCTYGSAQMRGDVSLRARGHGDWSEQQRLVGFGEWAGWSAVALDGDTLVLNELTKGKTLLVFERGADGFMQVAELAAPTDDNAALDGRFVLRGDTIAATSISSSWVYVFVRETDGWSLQQRLSGHATNEGFGQSLALDGDTLVIGVPSLDARPSPISALQLAGMGATYVFARNAGVWSEQAYLQADDPDARVAFGTSIAVRGDMLVVGTLGESIAKGGRADTSGAAYVFERSGGQWSRSALLTAPHPQPSDDFGRVVALSNARVAVAAAGESSSAHGIDGDEFDTSSPGSGAVFVFERDAGGNWQQAAYVKAQEPQMNALFGQYLALDGDTLAVASGDLEHGSVAVYHVGR